MIEEEGGCKFSFEGKLRAEGCALLIDEVTDKLNEVVEAHKDLENRKIIGPAILKP